MGSQSKGWNNVYKTAPSVYRLFANAQDHRPLLEEIRKGVGFESKKFLDVGTGTGKYAFLLIAEGVDEVVGIDKCGELLKIAMKEASEKRIKNLKFIELDAKKLPFVDLFDAATSAWAINAPWDDNYARLDEEIESILRAMRKGAPFFLSTTPPGEYGGELSNMIDPHIIELHRNKKSNFIRYLKTKWGAQERLIPADWVFSSVEEAALCFGVFYGVQFAEAILEQRKVLIKANAVLLTMSK